MADKEDLSLKLLQLMCIIDSKDRELQILREQASQDPEDIIYQLKQENEALKVQLNRSPSASTTAANGCAALPHGVQGAASEAVAGLQKSSESLQQLLDMLAGRAHGSAGTKSATANGIVGKHDELVQLNVSGTYMEVLLSVLLQFPASRLAVMFTEDSTEAPLRDRWGRFYLPYEAPAFSKIVSALQARHVFGPTCSYATIHIPSLGNNHADGLFWAYVKDLVNHLGLQQMIDVEPDQHAESAAAAAATSGASAAAAAAAVTHKVGRRSSSSGGGDRKSHGGGSSSSNRGMGASKAAAAAADGAGSKAAAAAAQKDSAAAAAASAAVATALLDPAAFAEKSSAQTAAEAKSAVLQALQPLQQPAGGSEHPSPNRRDRYSRGGNNTATDKSHKSSSSSSGAAGHAAAGEGGNAAAAALVMNGGVSNAMAAAALKGLIQQKKS